VRVAAVLLLLLVAAPGTALAAGCPKTSTSDVADEVMCLQCGVPLNVAEEAPSAKRERAFIQQLVDQCRSKEEIKAALVAQFGDKVLADPKAKATWLVPALGFGAAAVALAFAAMRWRRRRGLGSPPPEDPPASTPAGEASRLQADLDRYDL
jgi:cytochrome c-type biogenesis protein CcmH/NrfF